MIRAADSASADLGLASWRVGRLTCWLVDPYGPRAMPMEFLTDAQVIVDEGVGLPPCPGPAVRASDSFPKPPKEKEAGNRLTNTSAPGVIHGSYPSSETAWLTSLTPRAPVQVKVAGYGRFDGVPSRADLERFFFLDDADKDLLGD